MKLVSVIIPCYNVEEYIDRCLNTVVNQTLGVDKLEIILVNDASTDMTLEHLCSWEQRYPESILVINCDQNGQQGWARNVGMQYASGEYITFIDSDDWVALGCIEEMLVIAMKYQSDIVCSQHDRVTQYQAREHLLEDEQILENKGKVTNFILQERNVRKRFLSTYFQKTGIAGKLYKREFMEQYHITFPEGIRYEDTYFSYMAFMQADVISVSESVLYHYFYNSSGTVFQSSEGENKERLISLRMFYDMCIKNKWLQNYPEEIEWIFIRKYFVEMLEVMFRRYEKVDYIDYLGMRDWLVEHFPEFYQNPNLEKEESQLDKLFIRCILENFDEQQLDAVRKAFIKIIYQKDSLGNYVSREKRNFAYPQREDYFKKFKEFFEKQNLEEVMALFYCFPLLQTGETVLDVWSCESGQSITEIYRYMIEREAIISYMKECMKGIIAISLEERKLYEKVVCCLK